MLDVAEKCQGQAASSSPLFSSSTLKTTSSQMAASESPHDFRLLVHTKPHDGSPEEHHWQWCKGSFMKAVIQGDSSSADKEVRLSLIRVFI